MLGDWSLVDAVVTLHMHCKAFNACPSQAFVFFKGIQTTVFISVVFQRNALSDACKDWQMSHK